MEAKMDTLLEAALNEKERLVKDKEAIDIRLSELDVFIKIHASLSKRVGESVTAAARPHASSTASNVGQPVIATAKDVLAIAQNFLSEGRWATTEEIAAAVLDRGYSITASNPIARISQILSGSGLFNTQRGRGWTTKDGVSASASTH